MRLTIPDIQKKRKKGEKISMITTYDSIFTNLVEKSEIDMILVGDSLGMVVQGHENTLPVTMDQMVYHTEIVSRNSERAFIVADMPFLSYQISDQEAIRNGGRLLKEGRAQAVKIEGGIEYVKTIESLVKASIPVMGHIGLLPQSIHKLGKFKVQGKKPEDMSYIIESAKAVEEAGAFAIVLEAVPYDLAKIITETVSIPTIGIGAGPYTDGQVLVIYDMLGMNGSFSPKFLKKYLNLEELIVKALKEYKDDVEKSEFPTMEHSFKSKKRSDILSFYSSGK